MELPGCGGRQTRFSASTSRTVAELKIHVTRVLLSDRVTSLRTRPQLAVAEAPGRTYNPLYLYGGVGFGKTHLMHACGHAIKARNQHLKLCYISSERFMNDLIDAIR